jgi:multiple sugar transport system ATP-binding protein
MRTEIKKLHAKVKSTVVYVTHDQVEAMTLSDRIVIMRDGHIEQVGSPDEVFRRPATRFVAGFIGSPPMNLREASVSDGRLVFPNGTSLPLPRQFRNRVSAGDKVVFGLRPDDAYPAGHGLHSGEEAEVCTLELPVTVTEPLGNETLVFADFDGADLVARMLNPKPLKSGESVKMSFDLSQAHLFSAETGKTLRG